LNKFISITQPKTRRQSV